jgi:DNA-directed RNA polymerase subunit alpha
MRIRWRGFELPTHVVLEKSEKKENYGRFIAEPFERGYGVTIGNSLRRVLLSSLEGAAVTSLRLEVSAKGDDGREKVTAISHEFTAIPGMYEDVTDLVLNLKELRIWVHVDEPVTLRLEKRGPGPVTAADIRTDERFEVVNRDLVLCTLTESVGLNLEMTARRGRGYRTADENTNSEAPKGVIPVDSIFTPVKRVRYKVENTRVGQQTDYDKLVLEIWTDGTLDPETALVEASSILRKHFNPFVKYYELGKQVETVGVEAAAQLEPGEDQQMRELREKLKLPVSVLDPSVRAENCLAAAGIQTLGDLVCRVESDMLKLKNFGRTSLKELKKKLNAMNLNFGMEMPTDSDFGATVTFPDSHAAASSQE